MCIYIYIYLDFFSFNNCTLPPPLVASTSPAGEQIAGQLDFNFELINQEPRKMDNKKDLSFHVDGVSDTHGDVDKYLNDVINNKDIGDLGENPMKLFFDFYRSIDLCCTFFDSFQIVNDNLNKIKDAFVSIKSADEYKKNALILSIHVDGMSDIYGDVDKYRDIVVNDMQRLFGDLGEDPMKFFDLYRATYFCCACDSFRIINENLNKIKNAFVSIQIADDYKDALISSNNP